MMLRTNCEWIKRPCGGARGRLAADGGHRPRRLDESGLADVVLELLAPDRVAEDLLELGVVGALTHRGAQVGLVEREEARAQAAVGGESDPVAVAAERLGDGIDEADAAAAVGEAVHA